MFNFSGTTQKNFFKDLFISKLMKLTNRIKFGDEAVANYVVEPGDVLIVENPVSSWLKYEYNFSHCNNCFKR